jgi:hypothetical protein
MNKENKFRSEHQRNDFSDELERKFADCVPVNIYELAKGQHRSQSDGVMPDSPSGVIGIQSQLETEKLWQNRLHLLLNAERTFNSITRYRKLTAILVTASMAILLFSLFVAPTLPPSVFYGIILICLCGVATYPAWCVATRSAQEQRDSISRMFYKSNHEVELSNGEVTLINRANYASVTKIHIADCNIGQLAT